MRVGEGVGVGLGRDWDWTGMGWVGRYIDLWGAYIDIFFNVDLLMTSGDDRTSVNVGS